MAEDDESFMTRALALAGRGKGLVSPNPMVGAVLVNEGRIAGEGYHQFRLVKHAETLALEMAGALARGATLYCTLEPCSHHGRTPPCSRALIEAGIARAVIAISDPDPRVDGRGIEQLRAAGVSVEVGTRDGEARRLNESYLKWVTTGTPFIHLVFDSSLEGEPSAPWRPSKRFLEEAVMYDAVVLEGGAESNRDVIRALLNRDRSRPLMIAGSGANELSDVLEGAPADSYSLVALHESTFEAPERDRVTSALVMGQRLDKSSGESPAGFDKLTLVASKDLPSRSGNAIALLGFNLFDCASEDAGTLVETTGYPRIAEPS